jgi:Flp pilus assembly protein TadG
VNAAVTARGRPRSAQSARGRGDRGQSTVEFALTLPFVVLLMLLLVEVASLGHDQVLLTHAAREAARAVAVSPDPGAARQAATAGGGLDPARLTVTVSGRGAPGSYAETRLGYAHTVDLPLIRGHVPDLTLGASATMRVET